MACRLFGAKPLSNQCWAIINWTPRNKLQWNFNQNTKLFIHENACENIVCEMAAILSRGRWVSSLCHDFAVGQTEIFIIFRLTHTATWLCLELFSHEVNLAANYRIILFTPKSFWVVSLIRFSMLNKSCLRNKGFEAFNTASMSFQWLDVYDPKGQWIFIPTWFAFQGVNILIFVVCCNIS